MEPTAKVCALYSYYSELYSRLSRVNNPELAQAKLSAIAREHGSTDLGEVMKRTFIAIFFVLIGGPVWASCPPYTYPLSNGTTADANQVMSNFNTVMNCANGAPQLNAVNTWSAGQSSTPAPLTAGSTITPNFSSGNIFTVMLTGNATLANPSNLVAGQCGQIFITQDSTGSRTLTYGSDWKFPGGTAPTLTTTAGATNVLSFCSWPSGTNIYLATQLTANLH